ncbi:MAG TPA: phospholipase D-like domain-containing protein, partial [bacterium]|nr:phospholipase D-like domain-containing protein [bacterium]
MSRYYKVSRILLWLLLIFLFANQLNAAKWWDVYFTEGTPSLQTNTEFEQNIKNIIETAKYSLYIASYTWGTGIGNDVVSVANALFQKGLDVKLVGDGSNEFNPAFNNKIPRNDDGSASGEMHNKLIIIDANKPTARVITGSTNWTEGAYSAQYNNSLVLYVPEVANEYAKEFTELFNGTFHGGALGRNQFTAPDGSRIELYFSPEDNPIVNKMVPAIRRAKKSVFMLANNLTRFAAGGSSDAIGDALIAAKNNGVVVEIVVDPDYYNSTFGSTKEVIDKLISRGIDCRILPNPTNQQSRQHNKIVIIDNELVITGSANFTKAASDLNDENQIYIHSPALAREYLRFFRKLMAESPARVSSPTFEQEPPSAVRNVIGNPTSDGIKLTWSQSNVSDFNRYYIYISKSPIVDVSNLRPEIANITDRKITEYTVKTFDSGSPLEKEQTYYLAVTVADLHGNESKVTATNGIYYTGAITGPYPLGSISFEENASQKTRDNSVLVLNLINGAAAGASISKIELDFGGSDSSFRLQLSQPKNGNWEYSHTTDKITYQGGIITAGDTAVFRIAVDNPVLMGLSNSIKLTATGVNSETREITLNGLNITPSDLTVEASISVKTGYSRFASEQTILQLTLKNTSKDTNEIKEIAIFGRNNNDEKTYNKIQLLSALEQPTNLNWIARDLTVLPDLSQIYFDARRGGSGLKNGQQDIIDFSAVLPTKLPKADNILVYILSSSGDTRLINVPFISDISYGDSVIIINEFMYNPAGQYDRYFEFIELYNKSDLPFDISGWSIDCDGIVTVFPEGTV